METEFDRQANEASDETPQGSSLTLEKRKKGKLLGDGRRGWGNVPRYKGTSGAE